MAQFRSASAQAKSLLNVMLAHRGRWLHGYELSDQTGLKSGTLYPILMRLSDRGVLEAKWEPSPHQGRPPRRLYRLTSLGVSFAREHSGKPKATVRVLSPGRAW
jgi:PadR family transcriptional regulator, regulatory protein PadR